jgi:hypothetical protein
LIKIHIDKFLFFAKIKAAVRAIDEKELQELLSKVPDA